MIEKALSVRQPWAWLIVNGFKPVENRNWPTKFRGEFFVHASLRFDKAGYDWVRKTFPEIVMPSPTQFDLGGIVGTACLDDCVQQSDSPWFQGESGFLLSNAKPIEFSPCKGRLGFFPVGELVKSRLAEKE